MLEGGAVSMQEARGTIQPDAVLRKLNMHIMVKFCLLVRAVNVRLPVLHMLFMRAMATDSGCILPCRHY